MSRPMTQTTLHKQTLAFAGTNGCSQHAKNARFVPAFKDTLTGRVEIARFKSGQPAPMHLITGLPDDWAQKRDAEGDIVAIHPTIIAGFVRDDAFYTREQAADLD